MLKKHLVFVTICIAAILIRFFLMTLSISPWWDPSMYVGMGKFFFSGGTIGFWEILRPPLWPLMVGIPWLFGFDPIFASSFLITLFALGTLTYLYYFGEKIEKNLGVVAVFILAFSPSYTFFSVIPTNDISSVFFTLIAAYFLLSNRYGWAGVGIAIAFLMRFPHGLFLVPFGLFILIQEWNKTGFKKLSSMIGGFAILIIPYLFINSIAFHNPILPLILGFSIVSHDPASPWTYYFVEIIKDNPLLLLSIVGIAAYMYTLITTRKIPATMVTLSLLSILVVGGYFTWTGHKELRYSFAFLPYLVFMAAYGFSIVWKKSNWPYTRPVMVGVILVMSIINFNSKYNDIKDKMVPFSEARREYYTFLPPHTNAITSSPQIMTGSDAHISGIFQSWRYGLVFLKENNRSFDYVALDTCQVYCPTGTCKRETEEAMNILSASTTRIFNKKDGDCDFSIFVFNK
jgi:4-amino-4-deoxy-L-arabinose transferase-like glycosyltransferase